MGLIGRPATLDVDQIVFKELQVRGSSGQRWSAWRRAIALLANGTVEVQPLISDVLPLQDWKRGFEKALSKEGVKVVLIPDEECS